MQDITLLEAIEEGTDFCPHCNSTEIDFDGGEFDLWSCDDCGNTFSEPNVK